MSKRSSKLKEEVDVVQTIGGFATLIGPVLSVLRENRLKALCLLKARPNGVSWAELEIVTGKEGGTVANAIKKMIEVGLVEKSGTQSNPIYKLTGWGECAYRFCDAFADLVKQSKTPPPYISKRQFERAKKLAETFQKEVEKAKIPERDTAAVYSAI